MQHFAGLGLKPWTLNMTPTAGSSSPVASVLAPQWLVLEWLMLGVGSQSHWGTTVP